MVASKFAAARRKNITVPLYPCSFRCVLRSVPTSAPRHQKPPEEFSTTICDASEPPRRDATRLYNRPMSAPAVTAIVIEKMTADDWNAVCAIYEEGITTGNATFEQSAPTWEKWNVGHLATCRLVARAGSEVLGWAALSPVSGRGVYAGVAEVSVYVAARARNQKLGS